MIGKFVE